MFGITHKSFFSIIAVFLFLSTAAQAGDTLLGVASKRTFLQAGKRFPAKVDLTPQFRDEKSCQSGGTCHVHSAVNLLEAACYRATGRKLDISETYYYYRHLRQQLYPGYKIDKEVEPMAALHQDGGFVERNVQQFQRGHVCLESDFACSTSEFVRWTNMHGNLLSMEFKAQVREEMEAAREKALLFKRLSAATTETFSTVGKKLTFPKMFRDEMDEKAGRALKIRSMYDKDSGHAARSPDPDLQDCLDVGVHVKSVSYSEEKLLELLGLGFPVACTGFVGYEGDKEPLDRSSRHVFPITGYERDPKTKKITFTNRDSNDIPMKNMECERLIVVYTGEEEEPYPNVAKQLFRSLKNRFREIP